MWKFRPSALQDAKYATMTSNELYQLYMNDNQKAAKDGVVIPSPPSSSNLRTCQWNVHYFAPTTDKGGATYQAQQIVEQLLQVNADVIVLNEFGQLRPSMIKADRAVKVCRELLEQHGYTLHTSPIHFPTVIATKLPIAGQVQKFTLDSERAAVAVPVAVQNDKNNNSQSPATVWIYGTHLEASDSHGGKDRRQEMERLLEVTQKQDGNSNNNDKNGNSTCSSSPTLVVGDFNQQREQDYTTQEWEKICESKQRRDSPEHDGVSTLLQTAGFQCVFDSDILAKVKCNWPTNSSPPSTHWSNTLIDYTYFRGPGIRLEGIHVSPSGLSDHRLVVCDWRVSLV